MEFLRKDARSKAAKAFCLKLLEELNGMGYKQSRSVSLESRMDNRRSKDL
jgi:hypothetical protein